MPESAGLLPYRHRGDALAVLLVHPGGPFWSRRDDGAWTIAKGEIEPGEAPLDAARREFAEETGWTADGPFVPLGRCRQRSGKWVHAWAFERDYDPSTLVSNTFDLEWPPRSGRSRAFPEVDRAAWYDLPQARTKILAAQLVLLDALVAALRDAAAR